MPWIKSLSILCIAGLMGISPGALADESLKDSPLYTNQAHSQAQFVFSKNAYKTGEKVLAGLLIKLEPEWHTYWMNSGDSGAPMDFAWKLPPGWKAGPIQYENPHRISTPPLESFGYDGEVLFFAELTPPSEVNTELNLELEAEWLVCKQICIPAVHTFKAKLPIGLEPQNNSYTAHFERAVSHTPIRESGVQGQYRIKGNSVQIELLTPKGWSFKDLFPAPKNIINNQILKLEKQEVQKAKKLTYFTGKTSKLGDAAESKEVLVHFQDPEGKAHWTWVSLKQSNNPLLPFLFFAFIGGVLLNLMPCVFPILSIKVFSLVKQGNGHSREIQKSNLLYIAGVLTSFWLLAFLLFTLREGGEALGWGFQLQTPAFVIFLVLLFSLLAFNFLGWFEIQVNLPGMGGLLQKEGPMGHFFTGVLSTVVASPCTAPFMGVSIGFALSQPLHIMLLIFTCLGLGLSFPYIMLTVFPGLARVLPRPGAWMEKLKTFMAFPLLATVIWLTWSLSFQVTSTTLALVWTSILLLGFSIWARSNLFQKSKILNKTFRAVVLGLVFWLSFFNIQYASSSSVSTEGTNINWQKFSPELVTELRSKNLPVFVDFTAAWCITCQVNKRVTFTDPGIQKIINDSKIQMLIADWTNRDPVITRVLAEYERGGVPLYLFYPAESKSSAVILPEILTPSVFKKNIEEHL